MKRAINIVGWILIFIMVITSIFYYHYGKQTSFLKADMRFFNITKDDIICSMQKEIEEDYITYYTEYYFRKEADRNYYYNNGDAEELTKIFLDIEDTEFHYSQAKLHSYSLGGVDLEIPVTTLGHSYLYSLSGARTGIEKCLFYKHEGITIKNGPKILPGTYYREGDKRDYITIQDDVKVKCSNDEEETWYISICCKEKEN